MAQTVVGSMYETGVFGEPDYDAAAVCYDKAVKQGDPVAALYLGSLFEDGPGVEQDFLSAANLDRRAAQAGYVTAAFRLWATSTRRVSASNRTSPRRGLGTTWSGPEFAAGGANLFLPTYVTADSDPAAVDASLPIVVAVEPLPGVDVQPVTTAEPATTVTGHDQVHLGSETSVEAAMAELGDLQARFPALLGSHTLALAKLQFAAGSTYYQLLAGPLADEAEADILCAQLQPQGQYCNPIPPQG